MLLCRSAVAQPNKIDSLETVVRNKSEIEKFEPLLHLAIAYYSNSQTGNALEIIKEAYVIAEHSADSAKIIRSARLLGQIYNHAGLNKEAENILAHVLPTARRLSPKENYPVFLTNLGYACMLQAKYDKAQDYNLEALKVWQNLKDDNWIAVTLHNMGLLHYKLKDNNKALRYFNETLELKKRINDPLDVDRLLINISLCHSYNHSFTEAKVYADSARSMCILLQCNDEVAEDINFSFGTIYFGTRDFVQAKNYFLKSFALASKLNDTRFQLDNLNYLTKIALRQGAKKQAREFLCTAENIIGKGTPFHLEESNIYNLLVQIYTGTSDYHQILYYQQKYADLKDFVYKDEVTNNLTRLEIDYVERKNKNTLASQNLRLSLQEISIHKQRQINLAVGVIILILATVAFLIYRNTLVKKRIGVALGKRVHERTQEIENNVKTVSQAASERNIHVRKISEEFYNSLASMNQLLRSSTNVHQTENELFYTKKLDEATRELHNSLQSLENKLHIRKQ
jgi:hypothetical protein